MFFSLDFLCNSILFGIGLAMDAFSVSIANGIRVQDSDGPEKILIAGVFAVFQTIMPLAGWFFVHTLIEIFQAVQPLIPWIALTLLTYLGIRMILEGIRGKAGGETKQLEGWTLLIQGIATSIDALSVGFTIAEYPFPMALTESLIIGLVTFILCLIGSALGQRVGKIFAEKASVLGGAILIFIGVEIFIKGFLSNHI